MIFGENDSQQPHQPPGGQGGQQQVRIDAGGMDTVYANSFMMASSEDEITMFVGANTPMPGLKQPMIKITHRMVLLPRNAKRLMLALKQTVAAHEDRFGPIELPPQQGGQLG